MLDEWTDELGIEQDVVTGRFVEPIPGILMLLKETVPTIENPCHPDSCPRRKSYHAGVSGGKVKPAGRGRFGTFDLAKTAGALRVPAPERSSDGYWLFFQELQLVKLGRQKP